MKHKEMAKICCFSGTLPLHCQPQLRRNHVVQFQCCSNSNTPNSSSKSQILKIAVSGVTELLRLFSPSQQSSGNIEKQIDEFPVSSVDDVLMIIKSDYDNAYFVTKYKCFSDWLKSRNFTSSIYTEDCIFEDPTIEFRGLQELTGKNKKRTITLKMCQSAEAMMLGHTGRELYARNLKLLVPFFDSATIRLQNIDKDVDSNTNFVLASWKLRTNLKLPWRPLISIDGSTYYELNEDFKIVRHVESWNVSALEAVLQIFNFKSKDSGD